MSRSFPPLQKIEANFLFALFVLFCIFCFVMKKRKSNPKQARSEPAAPVEVKNDEQQPVLFPIPISDVPSPDAFLAEAKSEPKRKLITDHIQTINVLRDEKRFTFRAIAEWLTERGIEADHSSVYRAYLAAIPEEQRDPRDPPEVWEEVDTPE
jgi:hypothetical protein